METKRIRASLQLKQAASEGDVIAVFSVLNVQDDEGDVVLPSFFTDGQAVPMAGFGHDWTQPIGKGTIRVFPDRAEFHGRFLTETARGREHYETVKAMGDLQEWSFGFRILESERGVFDEQPARFLRRGEIYEVSPVLVGANRQTYTAAIKRAGTSRVAESYEGLIERLNQAVMTAFSTDNADWNEYAYVVATYTDHAIVCHRTEEGRTYYELQYTADERGVALGEAQPVEAAYVAAAGESLSFAGELTGATRALLRAVARAQSIAELRRKGGKPAVSDERRPDLERIARVLGDAGPALAALLGEGKAADVAAGASDLAAIRARAQREGDGIAPMPDPPAPDPEQVARDEAAKAARRGDMLKILATLNGVFAEPL